MRKRPSRTTLMSRLLNPWVILFQLVEEDQRLKTWVGDPKRGLNVQETQVRIRGLEQAGETGEMTLQLMPDPHLLTFFRERCLKRATSAGLSSPTASAWGVLVCLTQRFRCKSRLIITRVRAVAETPWVKGAPMRRVALPEYRAGVAWGPSSGPAGVRAGLWKSPSEAWGWGKKVGAAPPRPNLCWVSMCRSRAQPGWPSPPRVPPGQDEICPQPTLQSCSCLALLSIFSVGLIISLSSCWGSPPLTGAQLSFDPPPADTTILLHLTSLIGDRGWARVDLP